MPTIWRIAITVALAVCAGIGMLIGYQVFVRGNELVVENLSSFHPNPALAFVLVEATFATFLIGLITFPYYLYRCMVVLVGGRSSPSSGALIVGATASTACVVIVLWLALIVLDLDGIGA